MIFTSSPEWVALESSLNLRIFPIESATPWGTPFLDVIFQRVRQEAEHPLCCYINSDIILLSQIQAAVADLAAFPTPFLATGRRIDVDLEEAINFSSPAWEPTLRTIATQKGEVHSAAGMDYFLFPRSASPELLRFAVGRPGWDNWIVRDALRRKAALVDTSEAINAIHQNHGYAHVPGGTGSYEGPEADHNRMLAGPEVVFFDITMATHYLLSNGLKTRPLPLVSVIRLAARIRARGFLSFKCLTLTANALKSLDRYFRRKTSDRKLSPMDGAHSSEVDSLRKS